MKACRDTFEGFNLRQLWRTIYKNYGAQQKKNITAMYINLSIEATFLNITCKLRKQEDLNDTLSVRLSHTREDRSNSR